MHPKLEQFWAERGPYFAELLARGGGQPGGYGFHHTTSEHPYGWNGLNQQEFFEHLQMIAYLNGIFDILGLEAKQWIDDRIAAEWQRVAAERKTQIEKLKEWEKLNPPNP